MFMPTPTIPLAKNQVQNIAPAEHENCAVVLACRHYRWALGMIDLSKHASQIVILMNHAREQAAHFTVDVLETESSKILEGYIEAEGYSQEMALDMLAKAFGKRGE
jgi:hypothetical protein